MYRSILVIQFISRNWHILLKKIIHTTCSPSKHEIKWSKGGRAACQLCWVLWFPPVSHYCDPDLSLLGGLQLTYIHIMSSLFQVYIYIYVFIDHFIVTNAGLLYLIFVLVNFDSSWMSEKQMVCHSVGFSRWVTGSAISLVVRTPPRRKGSAAVATNSKSIRFIHCDPVLHSITKCLEAEIHIISIIISVQNMQCIN